MARATGKRRGVSAPMTLRDVATRAGVSTSTVARVVHGNGYVAEATRVRVEAAMREGGFRLNAVASGLKRRRTTTIGAVLHETVPNPFFAEVALGIESAANEHGFTVLLYNARGSASNEGSGVDALLSQQVQAIIFAHPLDGANVELAHAAGVVVVEVERPQYRRGGMVLVDDYVGAHDAVRYLLGLGHEQIGFVGEPWELVPENGNRVVNHRLAAYRDAMEQAGADDDSLVVAGDYYADPAWPSLRTGRDYATRLLDRHPGVTAIFATSDLLAAGALQALYERRIGVPDDMSVIGFDDTFARHLAPPLTTVRMPMFDMGVAAAELAIELAGGKQRRRGKRESQLRTELVIRDSTAAPRRRLTAGRPRG